MKEITLVLLALVSLHACQAWCPSHPRMAACAASRRNTCRTAIILGAAQDNKDNNENEENEFDMEESLQKIEKIGDDLLNLSKLDATTAKPKLGIDIGGQLRPFSEQEAAELKAAAMEVINDGVAQGIDEIEKLRQQMKQQLDKQRAQMNLSSELQLQREQARLLEKIDAMTGDFLASTKETREETKLIAKADQAQAESGTGVEWGVWGMIGGAAVVTKGSQTVGLLGSVDAAVQAAQREEQERRDAEMADLKKSFKQEEPTGVATNNNRVVIIADTLQDPVAKQLVPAFTDKIQQAIPSLEAITIYKPTDTIPLGGDNAACAILFCTSLSDRSSVAKIMDRLLRKTMQTNGQVGSPPTQLVAISSVGTERIDKFPYSMQNLMGGKLDQRRQIEEAVMAVVQNRVTAPPLDFTICKFGDIKDTNDAFCLMPGDVLDGTTPLDTATNVLLQAVAYQPYARNATLCAIGKLPNNNNADDMDDLWDDAFLRLDGPELERWTTMDLGTATSYDQMFEYLNEWANNLALNPRGLTTKIRVDPSKIKASQLRAGVRERSGVQLLFLPTATGKNYLSREEERERESLGQPSKATTMARSKLAKEGGIEVVVEITDEDKLRIRAKRCNYAVGVPIKELSEETILKRLEEAIDFWCKEAKH